MRYFSVCSGIEAASVAWEPLGWEPVGFCEIEPFPSAVLAHRFPGVRNHGDMTKVDPSIVAEADVLVGGTPCQAFSVAGLRGSLADARGNLTLYFARMADAADDLRLSGGKGPLTVLWENVPGILSTPDNAFGCLLGALAGHGEALVPPDGKRWANAGVVSGPRRVVAWRVLDAQWFGVAQRRRRVFVLARGGAGRWAVADALLPLGESVRRDPPARGTARQEVAPTLAARTRGGGGLGTDFDCDGGLIETAKAPTWWYGRDVSQTLDAVLYKGQTMPEKNRFPAVLTPVLPFNTTSITSPGNVSNPQPGDPCHPLTVYGDAPPIAFIPDVAHTLKAEGFDASEDGTGRGTPLVFQPQFVRNGRGATDDTGVVPALTGQAGQTGKGDSATVVATDVVTSLTDKTQWADRGSETDKLLPVQGSMAVRRLTPRECERLQGFPDDWTLIPWRNKPAADCPDGPRYKACGNSMAVPVMRWIGRRIAAVLA
jgi:DNA (cytosine-5)-methyltransferase 1